MSPTILIKLKNRIKRWWRSTLVGATLSGFLAKDQVVVFVVATRFSEKEFWKKSLLGKKLALLKGNRSLEVNVTYSNHDGLPKVYNRAIENARDNAILVFAHDDIWLNDQNIISKIKASISKFDVVGVAGSTRLIDHQPSWAFTSYDGKSFVWNQGFLSGSVRHGDLNKNGLSVYGPSPAKCQLMDGVFMAARRDTLIDSQIRFDEIFDFHFYDLDFCRSATRAGLDVGTWPFDLLHESSGSFASDAWKKGHDIYFKKWGC